MVEVTQADRDVAATFFRDERTPLSVKFTLGVDATPLLECIARHRIASTAALEEAAREAREALVSVTSTLEHRERDGWMSGWVSVKAYDAARHALARLDAALKGEG